MYKIKGLLTFKVLTKKNRCCPSFSDVYLAGLYCPIYDVPFFICPQDKCRKREKKDYLAKIISIVCHFVHVSSGIATQVQEWLFEYPSAEILNHVYRLNLFF